MSCRLVAGAAFVDQLGSGGRTALSDVREGGGSILTLVSSGADACARHALEVVVAGLRECGTLGCWLPHIVRLAALSRSGRACVTTADHRRDQVQVLG